MFHRLRALPAFTFALVILAGFASLGGTAIAAPLKVSGAWVRAVDGMPMTAGYFSVENPNAAPDRLLSASAAGAASVTLHQTKIVDGVAHMLEARSGLVVPAHGRLVFAPGGNHLMIEGLKAGLKPGQSFSMVLKFEQGGLMTVSFPVVTSAPTSPPSMSGMKM